MIWLLIQMNLKGTKKKFMGAKNYDRLLLYINTFDGIRKIDDYHFDSDEYDFVIQMCEMLDWREFVYDKHQKGKKTWNLQKTKGGQRVVSKDKRRSQESK